MSVNFFGNDTSILKSKNQAQSNTKGTFTLPMSKDTFELSIANKKTSNTTNSVSSVINNSMSVIAEAQLTAMFLKDGFLKPENLKEARPIIKQMVQEDYKGVCEKYSLLMENKKNILLTGCTLSFKNHKDVLLEKKMTVSGLKEIMYINKRRKEQNQHSYLSPMQLLDFEKRYLSFSSMSSAEQKEFLSYLPHLLTENDLKSISSFSALTNFCLVKDMKKLGVKKINENLNIVFENKVSSPILVDETSMNKFQNVFYISQIEDALKNVNLKSYWTGMPLKYGREDFVSDFKTLVSDLSEKERNQVYSHFEFSIDKDGDIIKYPIPSKEIPVDVSSRVKQTIEQAEKLVSSFMLENSVSLKPQDVALENWINDLIKIFPEFVPLIGKIEHRGDSIDYHTLDVLQKTMKNPSYASLSDSDKKILVLTVLLHDYAKPQGKVDYEHPKNSSFYAKEIVKKLPIPKNDKERVYNLIKYSHWTTDKTPNEDLAVRFRRPSDFEIAKIIALADRNSSGFYTPIDESKIEDIQRNIDKINSTGILLYPDSIPFDSTKFDVDEDGTKYLDFSDLNADVLKYGFPEGTKAKDLKFLFHTSYDAPDDVLRLCDDSKDIALSTSYLSLEDNKCANYNFSTYGVRYLIGANNENIALVGKTVGGTGTKKGYEQFKEFIYSNKNQRTIPSNEIKKELALSDDEYAYLFSQISSCNSLEEISDVKLLSGRVIAKADIINCVEKYRDDMLEGNQGGYYLNEAVVFSPKVLAFVIDKKYYDGKSVDFSIENINKIKELSRKENIPIVLV